MRRDPGIECIEDYVLDDASDWYEDITEEQVVEAQHRDDPEFDRLMEDDFCRILDGMTECFEKCKESVT